jgi:hypothetical protein
VDLLAGNNAEAEMTMKGLSETNKVVRLDFNGLSDFYNESVMILADAQAPIDSSFIATTYGVSTMFMDIGSDCQITATSWNCSDHHFDGNVTQPVTIPNSRNLLVEKNGVKWVVAVDIEGYNNSFSSFSNDVNFNITANNTSMLTVMHCETTVWEVEYFKTGEAYIPQSIKPADDNTAKLIFSPLFPGKSFRNFNKKLF